MSQTFCGLGLSLVTSCVDIPLLQSSSYSSPPFGWSLLGLPQLIICLHLTVSLASSSVTLTLHSSTNLIWALPPVDSSVFSILCPKYSLSLLCTNHLSFVSFTVSPYCPSDIDRKEKLTPLVWINLRIWCSGHVVCTLTSRVNTLTLTSQPWVSTDTNLMLSFPSLQQLSCE